MLRLIRYVCIYDLAQKVLLKRFCISNNMSLDGTRMFLNSKDMTEAGAKSLLDVDSDSDVEDRLDSDLPGVTKGDYSSRNTRPAIRTKCVAFAPTGRAWAAASTAGLLVYSLDDTLVFDPFDLDMEVTPENVRKTLANREFTKALVMAFRSLALFSSLLCQHARTPLPATLPSFVSKHARHCLQPNISFCFQHRI